MARNQQQFLVADLNRAVNFKFSFFFKSPSERLMQFLLYNKRKHTANKIANAMNNLLEARSGLPTSKSLEESYDRQEKEKFLNSILETSKDIFKIHVPAKEKDETNKRYKERLESFYISEDFLTDLKLMHEYKKLVSQVFNDFGYESISYDVFGEAQGSGYNKANDFSNDKELASKLSNFVVKQQSAGKQQDYVYPFSYPQRTLNFLNKQKVESSFSSKVNTRRFKSILFYATIVMATLIGLGEGAAPATFMYASYAAVYAFPVAAAIAGLTFFAGFSVSAVLFQGASYNTFRDLFFKNRLFKDAKGNSHSAFKVGLNFLALGLAMFSAFTIAGLSFVFSVFSTVPAAVITAMTFLGFTGVLTYEVMKLLDVNTLVNLKNFLKELLVEPLGDLKTNKFNLLKLGFNILALVAMSVLGVTVVAATSGMFFSALSSIPVLTGAFGLTGVKAIVAIAEVALGTFFITNVSRSLNTIRTTVLALPDMLKSVAGSIFYPKLSDNKAYKDHPVRTSRVTVGFAAGAALLFLALDNAAGFAPGYESNILATANVGFIFGPLLSSVLAPVMLARFIAKMAATSYVLSSVGGNAGAALSATKAPQGFHVYDDEQDLINENVQLPPAPPPSPTAPETYTKQSRAVPSQGEATGSAPRGLFAFGYDSEPSRMYEPSQTRTQIWTPQPPTPTATPSYTATSTLTPTPTVSETITPTQTESRFVTETPTGASTLTR